MIFFPYALITLSKENGGEKRDKLLKATWHEHRVPLANHAQSVDLIPVRAPGTRESRAFHPGTAGLAVPPQRDYFAHLIGVLPGGIVRQLPPKNAGVVEVVGVVAPETGAVLPETGVWLAHG